MKSISTITEFTVQPSSTINGKLNTYTFTLTTPAKIVDGDVLKFTVPDQVTLPATIEDLNITPLERSVAGSQVKDELLIERSGQTLIITFTKVAPITETYKWTLDNIRNPPSERPSDPFLGIYSEDKEGWGVQEYTQTGPTITNLDPALLEVYDLVQRSEEPAAVTTYEISFTPVNPLPPDGSIQIAWPDNIELTTAITCTVVTNKAWENKCNIEPAKLTITITEVFSESTAFASVVTVTLVGVNNPKNNKERGRGFLINTYDDKDRTYRMDYIPANVVVPILDCDYPCRTCLASDRSFCQTCWLQEWSERKYFYED